MDKSKPSLTFLDFTPEVRITVYQLVFNGVHLSLALPVSESKSAALLEVSKLLRREASPVFYRNVLFMLESTNLVVPSNSRHPVHYSLRRAFAKQVEIVHVDGPRIVCSANNHIAGFAQHAHRRANLRIVTYCQEIRLQGLQRIGQPSNKVSDRSRLTQELTAGSWSRDSFLTNIGILSRYEVRARMDFVYSRRVVRSPPLGFVELLRSFTDLCIQGTHVYVTPNDVIVIRAGFGKNEIWREEIARAMGIKLV
jgi:hypothetical protein